MLNIFSGALIGGLPMSDIDIRCNNKNAGMYEAVAFIENTKVCRCAIAVKDKDWQITSWYTEKEFSHRGYGKQVLVALLQYLTECLGTPVTIDYVWNGQNQYVMDWLVENFNPVCKLPLAVRKYSDADDWEAHIYKLDKQKVLDFCA